MSFSRRDLIKGLAMLPLAVKTAWGRTELHKMMKPRRLKAGDTVALIAPSSGVSQDELARALQNMSDLGLKTKLGKFATATNGFLAGKDGERVEDIHWAFGSKDIDGVWCLRGGYGLSRILPKINFDLIKANPKVFIGYSDVTALHLAIHQRTGMVTFHGPGATANHSPYAKEHLINTLFTPKVPDPISGAAENAAKGTLLYTTKTIVKGKARGRLIGGNLSLITALAGTPYALKDVKGRILFIEDVGEKPYRIDRMLVQLIQSVDVRQAAGIALGIFQGCEAPDDKSQSVIDVVTDQFGSLGIPVVYGLSFGHIRDQFTLPIGIEAELNADSQTLTLLESGVI